MNRALIERLRDIEDDAYEGSGSPSLCGEAADALEACEARIAEKDRIIQEIQTIRMADEARIADLEIAYDKIQERLLQEGCAT